MSDCPNCQRMNDQLVEVTEANNALQTSLVESNRQRGRLQAEITKLQSAREVPEDIREVFVEWQWRCGMTGLSLVESRRKLIAARLNDPGCDVRKLKRAIYGFSRFPFATKFGRSETGTEDQRYLELKTIFRDGEQVDAGVKLAVKADRLDGACMPGETPWPVSLFEDGEVIRPGPDGVDREPFWLCPAPCHGDGRTLAAGAVVVEWGRGGTVRARCLGPSGCGDVLDNFERLRDGKPLDQMDLGALAA